MSEGPKSGLTSSNRIADDGIYLNENRYDQPKAIFRMIADLIEAERRPAGTTLLDVGCATGEFIYYLGQRFPDFDLTGMDVSDPMITRAREQVPAANFIVGSALDAGCFPPDAYDVALSNGVLCLFDEVDEFFANLLKTTRPGASIFVHTQINENPIDVVMRYRRTGEGEHGVWESGWNIFSRETIEAWLNASGAELSWDWIDYELPFAIEKTADPMRSWTIPAGAKPHQRVNGAEQLVNTKLLYLRLGAH